MESKNAARFLAFDSLKGLKEAIKEADDSLNRKSATLSSEDEKEMIDIILYSSYKTGDMIYITYIHKGIVNEVFGCVKRIDYIKHALWTQGGKKILFAQITGVREP